MGEGTDGKGGEWGREQKANIVRDNTRKILFDIIYYYINKLLCFKNYLSIKRHALLLIPLEWYH